MHDSDWQRTPCKQMQTSLFFRLPSIRIEATVSLHPQMYPALHSVFKASIIAQIDMALLYRVPVSIWNLVSDLADCGSFNCRQSKRFQVMSTRCMEIMRPRRCHKTHPERGLKPSIKPRGLFSALCSQLSPWIAWHWTHPFSPLSLLSSYLWRCGDGVAAMHTYLQVLPRNRSLETLCSFLRINFNFRMGLVLLRKPTCTYILVLI